MRADSLVKDYINKHFKVIFDDAFIKIVGFGDGFNEPIEYTVDRMAKQISDILGLKYNSCLMVCSYWFKEYKTKSHNLISSHLERFTVMMVLDGWIIIDNYGNRIDFETFQMVVGKYLDDGINKEEFCEQWYENKIFEYLEKNNGFK